jgi:DNA polymerase
MSWLDADYSAVEARITVWLAGQTDALEEYRNGVDRYKRMASLIYRKPEKDINKFPERFVGKQATLGCGFSMGPPKFRTTCKVMGNYDLPPGLEDTAVAAFRASHKAVVKLWYAMEEAAKKAILHRNTICVPKPKRLQGDSDPLPVFQDISFCCKDIEGMLFLLMKLPSGRKLAYPRPHIGPSRKFPDRTSIYFFGNTMGTNWGDVDTFHGKLVENAVQGIAADIMAHGAATAEKNGFRIATLIHDQAIAFHGPGQTAEGFVKCLTDLPSWATGLPLEADGSIVPWYRKD